MSHPVITDFSVYKQAVGSAFSIPAHGAELRLDEVRVIRDTDFQQTFSLQFAGPAPLLPQGTYDCEHASLGPCSLFLVPIQQTTAGFFYEAAFNLLKSPPPPDSV